VADAIARMVQYLTNGHEKWTPDRNICPGPKMHSPVERPKRRPKELDPRLKGRILAALRDGPKTCLEISRAVGHSSNECSDRLTRLLHDGFITRTLTGRSPTTRRLVQVYALREPRA